jgi:hypothetical protein
MRVETLLRELKSLGVFLRIENGKLRVRAQARVLTDAIKTNIAEHKDAIIRRLEREHLPLDHWHRLADSNLTDMDVVDLDDAMFLFAYRMIQHADQAALDGIWKRYSHYWRKRQQEEAFQVVLRLYELRSTSGPGAME